MLNYVKNAKVKKTDLASTSLTAVVTGEGPTSEPETVFSMSYWHIRDLHVHLRRSTPVQSARVHDNV